jgi:hypothetical protein
LFALSSAVCCLDMHGLNRGLRLWDVRRFETTSSEVDWFAVTSSLYLSYAL